MKLEIIARIVNTGLDSDEVAYFNSIVAEKLTNGIMQIDPAILEEPGVIFATMDAADKTSSYTLCGLSDHARSLIKANPDKMKVSSLK